jgi:hypothetical protein
MPYYLVLPRRSTLHYLSSRNYYDLSRLAKSDMADQFYALTLERAISHYLSGDLTAKGLVHAYFLIRCKPGWSINVDFSEVCTGSKKVLKPGKLPLSKSTFYRAIGDLSAEKKITWEPIAGLKVTLSSDKTQQRKTAHKTVITTAKKEPRPLEKSAGEAYQNFLASLPPPTQAQFKKYAEEAVGRLPKRPVLVDSWIANKHQELWSEFQKTNKTYVPPIDLDFSQDPDLETKLAQVRENPAQWVSAASEIEERNKRLAFVEWARRTNRLWNE